MIRLITRELFISKFNCCGIDIAKNKFNCAIRPGDGKYKDNVFKADSSGFISFISLLVGQNLKNHHVCMKVTGIYWEAFAEYLIRKKFTVSVVNPAQIKTFSGLKQNRSWRHPCY